MKRSKIANYYKKYILKNKYLKLPKYYKTYNEAGWHLYQLQIDFKAFGKKKDDLQEAISAIKNINIGLPTWCME